MTNTDIRLDGKKSTLSAYERKMARQRPAFLNQATLDYIAQDSAAYLIELGKKSGAK
jgi:hypothetical protein